MKRCLSLLLLSLLCWVVRAQSPVVPNNIYFADMKLDIQESARTDIQKIVDALTKHPAYFQRKVDLADVYFPFIEQALAQEGVPTDFKYLVLQESGLVSDAVSTSNAVGFWQFKETSATELGIKVNGQVDERKHIIESSRGAAKYMLRSNAYYQNWFNSLLSYYQGLTGTKALTKTSDIGVKKMQVDSKTNKYLLTFLAHKVAYENAIGKNPAPILTLQTIKATPGQTLTDIAMQAQADAAEIERYNKWLLASTIPADKEYTVMVPLTAGTPRPVLAQAVGPIQKESNKNIQKESSKNTKYIFTTSNSLKAIVAQPGDDKDILAMQGGLSTHKFLKYNDMRSFHEIIPGQTYYLQAKETKATTDYHIARSGETMHEISQKYGIKLNKLLSKNRMKKNEALVPGRVVWLQQTRPKNVPVEIRQVAGDAPVTSSTDASSQATAALREQKAATIITTPSATKHIVMQGETLSSISRQYNISMENLMIWNRLSASASLSAGQELTLTSPTAPAVSKPAGAISVEVEDTSTPAYASVAKREEEDSTAVRASSAGLYPTKMTTNQTKPAPSFEQKAPNQKMETAIETPAPTAVEKPVVGSATTHVVAQGETLYSLSRQYNISMENLMIWNHINAGAPLSAGQVIALTSSTTVGANKPMTTPASSLPAAHAKPEAMPSTKEHTVAAGETLYRISRNYGVTPQELQKWNKLSDNSISVGQKLLVAAPVKAKIIQTETATPTLSVAPTKPAAGVITHKVAAGESMYQISRRYGVTIKEIMEWNNKADFNVTLGENLLIKPKQ